MRNRRFSPAFDAMEVRMTPSGGLDPTVATTSFAMEQRNPIDFDGPVTGVPINPFSTTPEYPDFSSDGGDCPGIDFGAPPTGVPIPIYG